MASGSLTAADNKLPLQPRPPMLSPEESLALMEIQPGYRLELVLSEPVIKEPVITVFDGNGRMYVAEMRTYMQDIDGQNQKDPISRVSMHEDTNGDGNYDRSTVFIDGLVLPRMLLPLDGSLLVHETDTGDVNEYWDTDGDGVADEKKLFYQTEPRRSNLEHQPSGLIWSMDNWMYTTYNAWRIRWTPNGVVRESTAPNGGQWGLAQDNQGKPWYVNAGGERGPLNFQVPIVYGAINVQNQFAPNYPEVYPLVPIPDVQGGKHRFRPNALTLNHFTATCGAEIIRAHQLPGEMQGDLIFAEPVGRLIRRTKIDVRDGLTYLDNAHPGTEFIRSSDPNFRPVNIANAPDGTLYISDMYRGIIQEGAWVRPGSYLRTIVEQYQLDKNFGRGRIWRLVHDSTRKSDPPRMLDETPAQLVRHLEHPNGWWRDTAQKTLILRQDKSVVHDLKRMAKSNENHLAKIHALWTLEGLGEADTELLRGRMKDPNPQVRAAAIRVSESLFKANNDNLKLDLKLTALDSEPEVVIQSMLTMNHLKFDDVKTILANTATSSSSAGVKEIARQLIEGPRQNARRVRYTKTQQTLLKKSTEIYQELCFACHGKDGKGAPIEGAPGKTMAPSFVGSNTIKGHPDGIIKVILHGLTGPVDGKTYDALMVPMGNNDDDWVAAIASGVRVYFGKKSFVSPKDVARVRADTKGRTTPWTIEELRSSLPRAIGGKKKWKLSASHNTNKTRDAVDEKSNSRYDTGASQVPGMWFQVELPDAATLSEINLNTTGSNRDYPRGYEVRISDAGNIWSDPIAAGKGDNPVTDIVFDPVEAKFIRIIQTGSVNGLFWSIHEMDLFKPGRKTDYAKARISEASETFE